MRKIWALAPIVALSLITAVVFLAPSPFTGKHGSLKSLKASGATFPMPQIESWAAEFRELYGVSIEYGGGGSGRGQSDLLAGLVDFACSDVPLKSEKWREACEKGGVLQFPIVLGAAAVVYNVPEIEGYTLKLSGEVVAKIYLGEVEYWDDDLIKELNPDLADRLPHERIIAVHRADSSGTTAVFTRWLSIASREWSDTVGHGKVVKWPVDEVGRGIGQQGNQGVAAAVKTTRYSIGYVELAYALTEGLPMAAIENRAGNFVLPGRAAVASAVGAALAELTKEVPALSASADWHAIDPLKYLLNAPGSSSYPLVTWSYMLVWAEQTDERVAEALRIWIRWILTEGQEEHRVLEGYAPLPPEVAEIGLEALELLGG